MVCSIQYVIYYLGVPQELARCALCVVQVICGFGDVVRCTLRSGRWSRCVVVSNLPLEILRSCVFHQSSTVARCTLCSGEWSLALRCGTPSYNN